MPEKKTTNSIHEEHRARMQERVARDGLTSLADTLKKIGIFHLKPDIGKKYDDNSLTGW